MRTLLIMSMMLFSSMSQASLCEGLLMRKSFLKSCEISSEFVRRARQMRPEHIRDVQSRFRALRDKVHGYEKRRVVTVEYDLANAETKVIALRGVNSIVDFVQMVAMPECGPTPSTIGIASIVLPPFAFVNIGWIVAAVYAGWSIEADALVGWTANYLTYHALIPVLHNEREHTAEVIWLNRLEEQLVHPTPEKTPLYFHRDLRRVVRRGVVDRVDLLFSYVNGEATLDIVIRPDRSRPRSSEPL